nr:DNA methyltransferase [Xanthomonas theicola]
MQVQPFPQGDAARPGLATLLVWIEFQSADAEQCTDVIQIGAGGVSDCARLLKDGAPVLLFTDWRQLPLTTDALQIAGFTWRGITVWDKTQGVRPQLGRFRNQAEYIVWGSKGHMPLQRRSPALPGVIREPVCKADKHHLTGKPTALMRQLVRICEQGGRILDPFAGSGTTLAAAALEGYGCTGVEMTAHYADVARERLANEA